MSLPARHEETIQNELGRRITEWENARQFDLNQCRQTAFQDGLRQGREESAADVKAASARLAQVLRELAALKRKIRTEAESELVQLSLAVARRILHRELNTDPESIQGIIRAALEKLNQRDVLRIRVHHAIADAVRSSLQLAGRSSAMVVVSDPNLTPGSIVFETGFGELDASVDTQLQEIQRGFADRMSSR
ncbi:MAG: hypothetical protein JOY54_20275 [Acidobacteriaceae bacterium]|nr:hypothetical protein [Acidobacteriaceae bacterium]